MLIAEAKRQGKPYGLIIRDITGGNTNTSSYGYQAFKGVPRMVYRVDVRDGKETLVRGVEIVGTPLSSVNRILATGAKAGIFNGFCGAESGNVPVSTVAPGRAAAGDRAAAHGGGQGSAADPDEPGRRHRLSARGEEVGTFPLPPGEGQGEGTRARSPTRGPSCGQVGNPGVPDTLTPSLSRRERGNGRSVSACSQGSSFADLPEWD